MCCTDRVSLEIHIMSPSAPGYGRGQDHFIKVLTHEMMNTLHYEAREPPNISPPRWVLEGLAEYEGYFNTTPGNKARTDWLFEYVYENLLDSLIYGTSLVSDDFSIISTDRYYASTVVMVFLAEHFGEGVHYELFQRPLVDILRERGLDSFSAFQWLGWWITQKCDALTDCEPSVTGEAGGAPEFDSEFDSTPLWVR